MGEVLKTNYSSSNPDKEYYITKGADGSIYCTCPGWRNTKKCKHLKEWYEEQGGGAAPAVPAPVSVAAPKKAPAQKGLAVGQDKIDPARFDSDEFQSQPWYQGCGAKIETVDPDDFKQELVKYEKTGKYVAEPKLDGIFIAAFSDGKKVRFWSRNQLEKPYGLSNVPLPAGTILIGELGFGSEHALQRRAEYGHDFMDVFGILAIDYQPLLHLSESDRRFRLEQFMGKLTPEQGKHYRLVPRWDSGFVWYFEQQHEGLVLKTKDGGAYIGKKAKPGTWIKAKKWFEDDMIVLDYEISDAVSKTQTPMVKNVICGQYVKGKLKKLVSVGSMSSDWSKEFAANFNAYKGKVIRLAHFGQFTSGSLRHPSMLGMRDDKDPIECVFDPDKKESNAEDTE